MRPEVENEKVMGRVRSLVRELLQDEVPPIVISYALAYIAAEFGLHAESDARRVLPTLLGAVARATAEAVPHEEQQEATPQEERMPGGVTRQ